MDLKKVSGSVVLCSLLVLLAACCYGILSTIVKIAVGNGVGIPVILVGKFFYGLVILFVLSVCVGGSCPFPVPKKGQTSKEYASTMETRCDPFRYRYCNVSGNGLLLLLGKLPAGFGRSNSVVPVLLDGCRDRGSCNCCCDYLCWYDSCRGYDRFWYGDQPVRCGTRSACSILLCNVCVPERTRRTVDDTDEPEFPDSSLRMPVSTAPQPFPQESFRATH